MNKVTNKHNVLQEEDRGIGKCMINPKNYHGYEENVLCT